jgi:hypothetical protein
MYSGLHNAWITASVRLTKCQVAQNGPEVEAGSPDVRGEADLSTHRCCSACGFPLAWRQRLVCMPCRFWAKVNKGPSCWLWTSNVTRAGGVRASQSRPPAPYGTFFHFKIRKAHHVAWELAYGPIPAGLEVLHTCDRTLCVRPDLVCAPRPSARWYTYGQHG